MKQNPLKEKPLPAGIGKILLAHLIPDAKNPRKDLKKGDPEFEKINKSVEKFGQLDPIIFNTRTRKILGGHQRLKVLDSQGYTELFTVVLGAYTWAFAEADLKELSEKEENAANIALNKAQGDWNIEQLTINLQELKLDDMLEFTGFDDKELETLITDLNNIEESEPSRGGSYNDEGKPEIEPYKAAYRIEAACHIGKREKCIELFAGRGALTYWYTRIFNTVITSDKQKFENQFCMTAGEFIKKILPDHMDFDYIDFDDEGTPAKDIQLFFEAIQNKKTDPFILALTDGAGLNLKCLGKFDFQGMYLQGDKTRKCTLEDYYKFPEYVCNFISLVAEKHGFDAKIISSHKKDNGNCMYITALISSRKT